jgi:glycosyltransferase involved in cell wall biosynthesis
MVPPGDAEALASKISEVVQDHERMKRMSKRNIECAAQYGEKALGGKRRGFYACVRRLTEEFFRR